MRRPQMSKILTGLDVRGSPSALARPRDSEHVVGKGVAENEFRVGETCFGVAGQVDLDG